MEYNHISALSLVYFCLSHPILSLFTLLICLFFSNIISGTSESTIEMSNTRYPQIGKPAPAFKGTAVVNGQFKDIQLSDYKGKYVVLFFYPMDL